VDFPIDVVLYKKDSFSIVEHRYEQKDMARISELWAEKLKEDLDEIPEDWMDVTFDKIG
jgi:putative proteasome-type protease